MDLAGGDVQIDTVERDDITKTLRDPTSPHRAGYAGRVFSLHREIIQGMDWPVG